MLLKGWAKKVSHTGPHKGFRKGSYTAFKEGPHTGFKNRFSHEIQK